MITLFLLLLRPALMYAERRVEWWRFDYALGCVLAAVLDIIICQTIWRAWIGKMPPKALTISDTLETLVDEPGPRQRLFIEIALEVNRISPSGEHIKAAVKYGTK